MSNSSPRGALRLATVSPIKRPQIATIGDAIRYGMPRHLGLFASKSARQVAAWKERNIENFERSLDDQARFDHGIKLNALGAIGHLWLSKLSPSNGVIDYGLVSCRVVTDAGVGYIVDAFQNLTELENMKYHALGTGTTAESAAQTALVTELTTQYSTANTRPTGATGEKSGDSKTYETSATITVSSGPLAITEHGIFSTATSGTGVLLDRSVFASVTLNSGESLQATYQLTFPSGS